MSGPLYLSANGARVTSLDVSTPLYGIPVADVVLAGDDPLVGPVALVVGNLTRRMAVLRQSPFAGSTTARLVAGAGGWGRAIPARAYQLASGVPLSMVLGDAAAEVGETVRVVVDRSVGGWYIREAGPAQRLLRQLAGELVWIDTAGVTQVGPRPTTSITSPATVETLAGGKGALLVATEDVAAWQPGATFTGPTVPQGITVGSVRIVSDEAGALRLHVLTLDALMAQASGEPSAADRTLAAFRALVRAEDSGRVAQGLWEYQVERADAATFDGSPTSSDFPLPPVVGVPYRGALAGASCVPAVGTLAYVAFANRDLGKPVLVAFGPTLPESVAVDARGTLALGASAADIDAGAALGRVVREGDTITLSSVGSGVVAITVGLGVPPAKSRLKA